MKDDELVIRGGPTQLVGDLPTLGEIEIRAGYAKPGKEPASIRLCPNGDIWVNGKLAENDLEVVNGMREFLLRAGSQT